MIQVIPFAWPVIKGFIVRSVWTPFLAPLFGLFAKRPILILYAVLAVAFFFAFRHYQSLQSTLKGLEAETNVLETALEGQKGATDAAVERAEEIRQELESFGETIIQLQEADTGLRRENAKLRRELENIDFDQRIADDPVGAGLDASRLYNDNRRVYECASRGIPDIACGTSDGGTSPTSATGPN